MRLEYDPHGRRIRQSGRPAPEAAALATKAAAQNPRQNAFTKIFAITRLSDNDLLEGSPPVVATTQESPDSTPSAYRSELLQTA
jgi:hypothetical protein